MEDRVRESLNKRKKNDPTKPKKGVDPTIPPELQNLSPVNYDGYLDDTSKMSVEEGRKYARDWFSSKDFIKKYVENTGVSVDKAILYRDQALKNINKMVVVDGSKGKNPVGEIASALEFPGMAPRLSISDPSGLNPPVVTHETTHISGLDRSLSDAIRKKFGKLAYEGTEKERRHTTYLNTGGEEYAHWMQLRADLELKPGEKVTPEMIKKVLPKVHPNIRKIINNKNRGLDKSAEILNTMAKAPEKKRGTEVA